jgi:hypothetical protein
MITDDEHVHIALRVVQERRGQNTIWRELLSSPPTSMTAMLRQISDLSDLMI